MNKKTIVALVIFVALLGTVYLIQSRPQRGQRVGERARPLPAIKADAIGEVSISSKGATVVLVRAGKDSWRLAKPIAYPADKYATDTLIEKLSKLELGDQVSEQRARHAEYEVDDKAGVHVVAMGRVASGASGGGASRKTLLDFHLGKVIDDFTMLRPAGKDQVYQAVGALRFVFDRELKNWRKRSIIDVKQEDVRKLEVTAGAATTVLTRADVGRAASGASGAAAWRVERVPDDTKIDQLDDATVANLLSTFYSLAAFDFADGIAPDKSGLDKPAGSVTAQLKSGGPVTLVIGGHKDDDYWVQRKGEPQVFVIKKYSVENLLRRPIDFRDKTVLSLKADEVVALAIEHRKEKESVKIARKGNDWLGGDGKPLKDASKVKGAIEALAALKAEAFASASAEELGMDPPEWVLEIAMKDRTKHQLSVGSKEKDGFYGLARKGVDDLFVLRKYALDRFLLDPKSYK
jgi:hypothetical protein